MKHELENNDILRVNEVESDKEKSCNIDDIVYTRIEKWKQKYADNNSKKKTTKLM